MRGARRQRAVLALLLLFLGACAGPSASAPPPPPPGAPPPPKPRSPSEQARDLFAEGVTQGRAGAHEAAAEAFQKAYGLDGSLHWAAFNAGLFLERAGDVTRARAAYQAALQGRPDFAEASHNLTRLRIRTGRAAEAEADLRARSARFPLPAFRNQLVEAIAAQGRVDEAEAEAHQILRQHEHDAPAMVSLASIYYGKKRHELARMVLENARQIHPGDPAVWNKLAFVELALGNRPKALEHLRTAASLREDYPEAHTNYGAMLVDAEDYPGAVRELELAVKHAPASPEAWLNLGNAYRGEKRFDDAKRAYDRALLLDPKMREAHFGVGVLHLDIEKPGMGTVERLEKGVAALDRFAAEGGEDERLGRYKKEALALLEKERKRLQREERDRLRKEAEAKKVVPAPTAAAAPSPTADNAPTAAPPAPTAAAAPSPTADNAPTAAPAAIAAPDPDAPKGEK